MSVSTSSSSEALLEAESFSLPDLHGEVSGRLRPATSDELRRLVDPATAEQTVHWGREVLYRCRARTVAGDVLVVVKAFRNQSLKQRLSRRLKGSRAERSWRASLAAVRARVPVPEPVAVIESKHRLGPSFFVSRWIGGALEMRYLLRAMNAGREGELYPEIDVFSVLGELGRVLRRMHDADLWHRDVSVGNVLLAGGWSDRRHPGELWLVDLDRMRLGRRLTRSERVRDLSRLPLFVEEHRRALLDSYFGGRPPSPDVALYSLYRHGFLLKNRIKDRLRGSRRRLRALAPRSTHVHIPPADERAGARDRVVWDRLSDQPHLHVGRLGRLRVRAADALVHAREAGVVLRSLPPTLARYRSLKAALYERPVRWEGPGVGLRAGSLPVPELVSLVKESGLRRTLVRLHTWEDRFDEDAELVAALHGEGLDVALAVPQNRELVRDPVLWRTVLQEIVERFGGWIGYMQLGHAINRSKWGVWNQREYARLMTAAKEVLDDHPEIALMGPAVIDFELHATSLALNWPENPLRFDVVSSLLYVDRRGAPENRQAGFDTVDKVVLLRALIQASRHGDRPSWITEVNWPLREGPHSPAGRHVAVDEKTQAKYLIRYYLLVLASGMVGRVYWWQLAARGYGLVDPRGDGGAYRRRPAFAALAFLERVLGNGLSLGPLPGPPPLRLYGFEVQDVAWVVAWSAGAPVREWRPPSPVRRIYDYEGRLATRQAGKMDVDGSPLYLELAERDWESWRGKP